MFGHTFGPLLANTYTWGSLVAGMTITIAALVFLVWFWALSEAVEGEASRRTEILLLAQMVLYPAVILAVGIDRLAAGVILIWLILKLVTLDSVKHILAPRGRHEPG